MCDVYVCVSGEDSDLVECDRCVMCMCVLVVKTVIWWSVIGDVYVCVSGEDSDLVECDRCVMCMCVLVVKTVIWWSVIGV